MIDLGDAGNVANGFLNDEKLSLDDTMDDF